jgi:glycosyltransferase involved in cell wall biosynthesis
MYDAAHPPEVELRRLIPTGALRLQHIALIGNFPPRRCGIATFTADLRTAIGMAAPWLQCDVVAMSDQPAAYDFSDAVTTQIDQENPGAYAETARALNRAGVQLACVQHEFGIFGGPAGAHLLTLLSGLACPVVTTLHTVLERPDEAQMRVMKELIARSAKLVVMSRKGRDILTVVYGAPARKIDVIPHGAPDRAFADTDIAKTRFGFQGRDVMMTFGLLSPNKGIESAIRAMPRVVEARPETLYVIVGATHPHLVARQGESYRESLQSLATELGVSDNVRFVNTFLDTEELLDYLAAADLYVTPYLNKAQITSGTLSYAVALGKPVISTPYWHAEELLENGVGILTPFGDSDAIGVAAADLLSHPERRRALAERAYARGRDSIWAEVGARYVECFQAAVAAERLKAKPSRRSAGLSPSIRAIERMSDACGMFQHGRISIPDRHHGYCVDDNARALIFTQRAAESGVRNPSLERLAPIYAAFVEHAWNEGNGRFRNFMSYDRVWLEDAGSCDSCGRAFWSLGETAQRARDPDLRRWALHLGARALPHMEKLGPSRAIAFVMLGLAGLTRAGLEDAEALLRRCAINLLKHLETARREHWTWFDPSLAYDNARLPEALLRAGDVLNDSTLIAHGLETLAWLTSRQVAPSGCFRPVGNETFCRPYQRPTIFDQQPLEAAATVDACLAAFELTGDASWRREAQRAFDWYLGDNDLGLSVAIPESGGCYDGLCAHGVNLNQGAESILSYQLAACAMRVRMRNAVAAGAC